MATFDFPQHTLPDHTALVSLRHPTEYPMLGERLVSTTGLDIAAHEWRDHFTEEHVEHSTALHGRMLAGGDYMVGPLSRFALNSDRLAPRAAALAAEVGLLEWCVDEVVASLRQARPSRPATASESAR